MKTVVQILDKSLNLITEVKALAVINNAGDILRYSSELSDYGKCEFKISSHDPIFTSSLGDIFVPHKNHVRVKRGDDIVFQGAIVDNPKRTKDYVHVVAYEYEFYLDKNLIKRTSPDVNGTADIYRIFSSDTMSDAVTSLINETIADYASSEHVLKNMTLGTIENPNYPSGMTTDYDGSSLTGPWSFGIGTLSAKGPTLQFDYHTVLYVLKAFGIYSFADFEIDQDLKFNFKKFLGDRKQNEVVFTFGQQGSIIDFNAPRLGERQLNSITAIATDNDGIIVHSNQTDSSSVEEFGMLEGVAAYSDVKGKGILDSRIKAELPLLAKPDETNIVIYLDESAYPLGRYGLGDLITINIDAPHIKLKQIRRVVGFTVSLHKTGREVIALQTNKPQDWQLTE